MSGLGGLMSLLVVLVSHLNPSLPALAQIWDDWGGFIGTGVTLTLLLAYGLGRWHVQSRQRLQAP